MKVSMLNLNKLNKKIKATQKDWLLFFLVAVFFIGLVFGATGVRYRDNFFVSEIIELVNSFLHQKENVSLLLIFLYTLTITSAAVVAAFFIGLCAIGIPFVAIIPGIAGVIIGIISGYIYETYLLKGLGYCSTLIFPSAVITCVSILLSCKESIIMSKDMMFLLIDKRIKKENIFRNYCLKYLIYMCISCVSALTEIVLFNLFSKLFIF